MPPFYPVLVAHLDGKEVLRLAAPASIAPRDWALGVLAVQCEVDGSLVRARLRGNITGKPGGPSLVKVPSGSIVHVTILPQGAPPPKLPRIEPLRLGPGVIGGLAVYHQGAPVACTTLEIDDVGRNPAPRAFGHVYCRWLRNGACEPGYDMTDFLAVPEGEKVERVVSRRADVGATVSYWFGSA